MDDKLLKYKKYLSELTSLVAENGITVAWGHVLIGHMGEVAFDDLKAMGFRPSVTHRQGLNNTWAIITRQLTHAEAVQMLGPVTSTEKGPRGGFISITFGNKKFYSKCLKAVA